MFITLINGEEGKTLSLYKGASDSVKVQILDPVAEGAPKNLTGDTQLAFQLFADAKRSAAALDTITITPTTASAGYGVMTITDAEITVSQGAYFGFVKQVTSGGVVGWSRIPTTVVVK